MKKTYLITFCSVLFFSFLLMILLGQGNNSENIPDKQVREAVNTYSKLMTIETLRDMGFKSADQVKSLKSGQQFKKYMIELDAVRKFKSGDNVDLMIKELPSIEVSLMDDAGKIQTSVEFIKNKDKWESAGFGLSSEFVLLKNAQAFINADTLKSGRLIRIPALHSAFVAISSPAGVNFIVLEDNESMGLKKGSILPASEVILKLVKSANEYNGLPD